MRRSRGFRSLAAFLFLAALLQGCSDPKPPIRIGFIGGISGGNADHGQAGRNGAMLAAEQANAAGGVGGRALELLIRDDGNKKEMAAAAARELIRDNVVAIVGPFTTAMAEAVLAETEPKKMLVFSPTATADHFSGKDDHFFRLCRSATDNAQDYADFMAQRRGFRHIALAVDGGNPLFAGAWAKTFKERVEHHGARVVKEAWFNSRDLNSMQELAGELLGPGPEALMLVANAVDAANISQQVRKTDSAVRIVAVEWAGTQQLIELGGQAVEGVEVLHLFNKFGTEEPYLRFVEAFWKRFNTDPSFSSVLAYETMTILIRALGDQKTKNLRQSLLDNSPYPGLQGECTLDRFGDSRRKGYFVVVQGRKFAPAPE